MPFSCSCDEVRGYICVELGRGYSNAEFDCVMGKASVPEDRPEGLPDDLARYFRGRYAILKELMRSFDAGDAVSARRYAQEFIELYPQDALGRLMMWKAASLACVSSTSRVDVSGRYGGPTKASDGKASPA